jgi:hypothetical protein
MVYNSALLDFFRQRVEIINRGMKRRNSRLMIYDAGIPGKAGQLLISWREIMPSSSSFCEGPVVVVVGRVDEGWSGTPS